MRITPLSACSFVRVKNNLVAEYALKDMSKPMGVSEYTITKSLPEELEKQLPSVEDIESRIKK